MEQKNNEASREPNSGTLASTKDSVAVSFQPNCQIILPLLNSVKIEQSFGANSNQNQSANYVNEFQSHLEQMIPLVQKLQNEINEKNNQLKQMKSECDMKDEHLNVYKNLINKLEKDCNEKNKQLLEKNEQLIERASLIDKLKAECADKDNQAKAALNRLKALGKNMRSSNDLFNALLVCAEECRDQNQYVEALVYLENAIELEKSTQNRPKILSKLFSSKTYCHGSLMQCQETIQAATLSLRYNPNCEDALYYRASAYFESKEYLKVRKDLEKLLQLNPNDKEAREFLEEVQLKIKETK